ncbi:MAG: hydroxypyruvate isomerase family protein [Burkholderiales bacterium]|nr:hydroxypyruvate isomerase family protein [Burkholderiales bacterium]
MPRFAANLHYLFTEVPFLDRFAAAAAAGFRAVEFQVPYEHEPSQLRKRLDRHGLRMVLFDAPMGDWAAGDRGLAAVPGREEEFRASLSPAARYAQALDCDLVHVMAGAIGPGVDYALAERTYVENLRHAADFFAPLGVRIVIEPINRRLGIVQGGPSYTTEGMHGYFLNHSDHARRVIEQVNSENLFLHLDVYHMQMLEGHLAETLRANLDLLRHVQIAGVPGRHEPNVGEINYPYLFELLDEIGYQGWVGCEYRPRTETLVGLAWAEPFGLGAASR